ncbi:hypothetical protein K491DRAFT_721143 [Lophiostoma macrostomum CBS 122681]|uniref:Uncharacterized protein n=1 Tax=Lophiostoma macrostomum CBS 122681 TaxID=1314788 RepID=A0A6A6STT0_9PLEO|nr:hypothetical protein K491DRAFT_721143 [Lophiostoma macrostomum CBS 122681]
MSRTVKTTCSERTPLLPTILHHSPPPTAQSAIKRSAEAILLILSTSITLLQALVLYAFDYAASPPAFLCQLHLEPLASSLPLAILVALPIPVILVVEIPRFTREEEVRFARTLVLFCYAVGSSWRALLLSGDIGV